MTVISIISFLICVSIILFSLKKNSDFISPSKVFLFIWALAIGLADLKFSGYQNTWSSYSWIIIFVTLSSLLLGIYSVYVIYLDKEMYSVDSIRNKTLSQSIDDKYFFKIIVIVALFYFTAYLTIFLVKGYLPLFHTRPSESRVYFEVFGIGMLVHTAPCILFFVVQFFLLVKKKKKQKYVLFFIGFLTLLSYFLLLQRFNLIFWITISLVFAYYSSRAINYKNISIVFIVLGALAYSIQLVRMSKFVVNYLYYISKMKFDVQYAVFTEPYMYITMNLENYARAVTKLENYTFGYYTFNSILSLSFLKHWIEEYASIEKYPFLYSPYNTYTMFWDFYRDFGVMGIFIIPFVLGFLISISYIKMRTNPTVSAITGYSIFVFVIAFSFFNNSLGLLHFIFSLSIILFVTNRIAIKKNNISVN